MASPRRAREVADLKALGELARARYDIVAFVEAHTYDALTSLTASMNAIEELKSTETLTEA